MRNEAYTSLLTDRNYTAEMLAKFDYIEHNMQPYLDSCFNGTAFSNEPYTPAEKQQILDDLRKIITEQFTNKTSLDCPTYITTAGAPGVGKTFFIESKHSKNPDNAVYIDPDQVGLPALAGYQEDKIKNGSEYAYNKWRAASNFIANFMFAMACAESKNIIHGTTATSPKIIGIYAQLKVLNYRIEIELIFATLDQRISSVAHRNKEIIQVTTEDFREKTKPVFSRIHDAYFPYCDSINFYLQQGTFWLGDGEINNFARFQEQSVEIISPHLINQFHLLIREELAPQEASIFRENMNARCSDISPQPIYAQKMQNLFFAPGTPSNTGNQSATPSSKA